MTPDEQKLNEMFPGWRSTVRDPAFSAWLSKQSTLMQKRCYSERYEDAAMVLACYEHDKKIENTLSIIDWLVMRVKIWKAGRRVKR